MNRKILSSIFTISILALALGAGTSAWFTDTETTATNTFTAGTLSLDSAGFASFDLGAIVDNMAPGDVTGDVTIIIKNDGTLPLAWFGDWVLTGGTKLREAIYIDYAKMEFLDTTGKNAEDGGAWTEPSDNFILDGVGSGPYPDWYNTLAAGSTFGVVSLDVWDDNNGMGTSPYEHMGALKPDYAYKLTVRFGFAEDAGNEYQGDAVSPVNIKFKVDATQVSAGALDALQAGFNVHLTWLNTQLGNQP